MKEPLNPEMAAEYEGAEKERTQIVKWLRLIAGRPGGASQQHDKNRAE